MCNPDWKFRALMRQTTPAMQNHMVMPAKRRWQRAAPFALALLPALFLFQTETSRAHHSFAPLMLPSGEQSIETFDGTVRVYRIMNPHSAIIFDTQTADGSEESWLLELSPRAQLAREGWTDETLQPGSSVSVAIIPSRTPNRGRLRAILVHPETEGADAQLLVAYGIRGNTPVMQRLRERLPVCGTIDASYNRTECFTVNAQALADLEAEFPGHMGYVLE